MDYTYEDLHINDLKICNSDIGFKFGTDAVLLSWFAMKKKITKAVDLCSGNGIIPILLSSSKASEIYGIEIQKEQCFLFEKSIEINSLSTRVKCINHDIRDIKELLKTNEGLQNADLVTVNPPYFIPERNLIPDERKKIAKSEIDCTLEDVVAAACRILKNSGRICMIHKPERMIDIIETFRRYSIEPKEVLPVITSYNKKPEFILVEGRKKGGRGFVLQKPLFLSDKEGKKTDEYMKIYSGFGETNGKGQ